ncbi:hypothetical protein A3860_38805 [Niastella vici]|uniref:Uncharacterized protein n=1 Tax=Niastella vici TaxID=1703345 RepID=A0A1V9FLA6_9BACT|nr:hypothetical protein A3860_38805 [Niastella vici]
MQTIIIFLFFCKFCGNELILAVFGNGIKYIFWQGLKIIVKNTEVHYAFYIFYCLIKRVVNWIIFLLFPSSFIPVSNLFLKFFSLIIIELKGVVPWLAAFLGCFITFICTVNGANV